MTNLNGWLAALVCVFGCSDSVNKKIPNCGDGERRDSATGRCVSADMGNNDVGDAGPDVTNDMRFDSGDSGSDVTIDFETDQGCVPGSRTCADIGTVLVCSDSGQASVETCETGTVCTNGQCLSPCEAQINPSLGCEFWTVDLDQYVEPMADPTQAELPHSIIVLNPGLQAATVTLAGPNGDVSRPVPARGEATFPIPRFDVDGTGISQNTIAITSTLPVSVVQFSPLNPSNAVSSDATILPPPSMQGTEYVVTSWPTVVIPFIGFENQHGYVTIVATTATTDVTVSTTSPIRGGPGFDALAANDSRTVRLQRGDVLNLESYDPADVASDLTGTRIVSTQPIAVFSGHEQATVGACCADHIETAQQPTDLWGRELIAARSISRAADDVWRVVAATDGTIVSTTPAQPNATNAPLDAGEFLELRTSESFMVTSNEPVSLTQYMVGRDDSNPPIGDPAMVTIPSTSQFRDAYSFFAANGYVASSVVIVRQIGVVVSIDGVPIADAASPIGATGFERVEVVMGGLTGSFHELTGSAAFGATVYGVSDNISYAYSVR